MEDTIASTLSDALTWVATTTATAVEEWPTDQGDNPIIGPPAGEMTGPDDSEGSYFLVSRAFHERRSCQSRGELRGLVCYAVAR